MSTKEASVAETYVIRSRKCWKDHESGVVAISNVSTGNAASYSACVASVLIAASAGAVARPAVVTPSLMHASSTQRSAGGFPLNVALART